MGKERVDRDDDDLVKKQKKKRGIDGELEPGRLEGKETSQPRFMKDAPQNVLFLQDSTLTRPKDGMDAINGCVSMSRNYLRNLQAAWYGQPGVAKHFLLFFALAIAPYKASSFFICGYLKALLPQTLCLEK